MNEALHNYLIFS